MKTPEKEKNKAQKLELQLDTNFIEKSWETFSWNWYADLYSMFYEAFEK